MSAKHTPADPADLSAAALMLRLLADEREEGPVAQEARRIAGRLERTLEADR